MDLGLFSISLTVKDLAASKAFYEKLGFVQTGGDAEANYLIMMNGGTVVGLFHGMFEKNILTFNPGLTREGKPMESWTDVRELERTLRERGVEITQGTEEAGDSGPAHVVLEDPDGNPILIDQFF
ncbi:MAG: VOC family protein [Gemmatimonadales bacterium]|uniref:VOC family protein n=1 Tax=Candidatus Palauibacter polyketidifaciens TaxID=3056740 RepID=UPI001384F554|nr:VOC family protein [Candidatus Palauibacter polyketidifaciens]MXX67550.1 VOC family protein [Gemmatimonadales bacterium]MDE2721179.1 VOC family protein [Candidatus Palauibacter polyketidifaciens]MYE33995.1 VOC family protein [Gemmatimonadales bacterium]MYG20490.1 VOC family protein [Gemmatimonadales bacterium]MYH10390.1 VOC family protein [Gemmatimonadales bacterium]